MATAADVKIAYKAMNRTDLNDTIAQATADAINNGTTTLDAYIESELEKNVATTQAAVAIAAFVTGVTPTSDKLDALKVAADAQVASYTAMGSVHPELGAYEAFGVGFSETAEFSAKYDALSDTDFINAVYGAVFGVEPSAGAFANLASQIVYFENLYAANGVDPALAATHARGAVLGQIVGYAFVTASSADSVLDDQVAAALTAAAHGDTSVYGVPLEIDTTGDTFTLTQGTDAGAAFTGGAQDDTFNASVEQTGFLPIQTLNNTDDLDGGGGRNVLNAQLVNAFTIPLGLTNIQVVNIDGAPGFIVPPVTLDVINANAIEELNFRAPANDVTINNLTTALKTLGLSDDAGGNVFTVNHTGAATDGTADALDINLNNSNFGSAINLTHAGGGADQGYEDITINSKGGLGNTVAISSSHGPNTLNVEGDANLNLNGSGILNVATLHTVEAGTFTGDLTATFTGTGAVTVNSGAGDDALTFGDAVVATAAGGLGDDNFTFLSGAGGNASFTTADTVNGGDGDDSLTIVHTGAGVFLAPGVGAGIVGIETLVHDGDIAIAGNDLTVDMAESGSATKLLLQGDYDLGSVTTVNNLTDADTVIIDAGFQPVSQLNLNVANPGAALNITHLVLTGGQTIADLNTSLGTELLDLTSDNSLGVGGNAINDVGGVNHNIMISGDADLNIGSTGSYGFFGGQIDASTFAGDLTATIGGSGGSDIIVTAGLGNDLVIVNDFSSPGNADNIDISIGGSDTVQFTIATFDAGNPLTLASDSYHHVAGFEVANDIIQFDQSGSQDNLENTLGGSITGPVTLNILNVANGQFADGTTDAYNFIKFTTAVNTAGDSGNTAFDEAIGNGAIEVANGGVDDIMGAFYDATNSQMVLFTVDANSAISDANPTQIGIQPGITQGDDIDIVATVGMSYDAYLAFNGSNFGFVA